VAGKPKGTTGDIAEHEPAASPPDAPPPAPPGDPLSGLGTVLDLPSFATTKSDEEAGPATLGPLPIVDLKSAQFTLLGAADVFGHAAKATVAAVDGAKPSRWRVELSQRDGDPQALAEFCAQDGQLRFAWVRTSDFPHADLLRNCFLEISADHHEQCFALRKAQTIEPLMIQDDLGAMKRHVIPVAAMSTGLSYHLEVLGVSGPSPYYSTCKPPLENTQGKSTSVQWTSPASVLPVCAQISLETPTPGGFLIQTCLLRPANERNLTKQDKVFSRKGDTARIKVLGALKEQYDLGHHAAELQGKPPANQKAISEYEQKFSSLKPQLDLLKHLRCLDDFSTNKELRESVRIHVKIYTTVDGHRLDLVRSEPEEPVKQ
jgi:hypothetical protein